MKSVRYYGIHDVRFEDIPIPDYGPNDVLIRIAYSGICGSDLHIYNKGFFVQYIPSTMGHEFSGIVEKVGDKVVDFAPGDHVVGNPMVPCGQCAACREGYYNACEAIGFIGEVREGCFAEYIALPASTLVKAPKDVSLRSLALAEPLAVAINLLERAKLDSRDRLAIIGAGPIGLLSALVAIKVHGVENITIVNRSEGRRILASKAGIPRVLDSLPEGELFDTVIETAGKPQSFDHALVHTKPGGNICVVSIFEENFQSSINTIVGRELKIIGCNAYTQDHIAKAVKIISSGIFDFSTIITGEFDLREGPRVFEIISEPGPVHGKIVFRNTIMEE